MVGGLAVASHLISGICALLFNAPHRWAITESWTHSFLRAAIATVILIAVSLWNLKRARQGQVAGQASQKA